MSDCDARGNGSGPAFNEQNVTDAGIVPAELYRRHREQFSEILPWLSAYYDGHANAAKIITLLDYWLFASRAVAAAYGLDGVRAFCGSGFRSPIRFAYQFEFEVDISLRLSRRPYTSVARLVAASLPKAYLPGGRVRSIHSRVLARLTRFALASSPISFRDERKAELAERLTPFFADAGSSARQLVDQSMPVVFFADQIDVPRRRILNVDGAPAAFMDFCGFENLLLFSCGANITGRQHGGGYDLFRVDYFLAYERRLCDRFVGWGLSGDDERQHRYPRTRSTSASSRSPRRVVIVERPLYPRLMLYLSPSSYVQYHDNDLVSYVYAELQDWGRPYFSMPYPGRLRSHAYDGKRGEELPSRGRGEAGLRPDDIVIFDITSASLMHHCIENDMIFILVVGRSDVDEFTPRQAEWFRILREAGLAFFQDDAGMLASKLREATADSFELPRSVREYHQRTFIEIPGVAA